MKRVTLRPGLGIHPGPLVVTDAMAQQALRAGLVAKCEDMQAVDARRYYPVPVPLPPATGPHEAQWKRERRGRR